MATDIIARGMITEYKSGTNINFAENEDGSVTISASGSISSEDSVARDAINNHKSDTSNPHNVTPAQIGLGNVDNTSDLDKPISTAVQKAIDNKADKTVATTSADGLMSAEDKGKLDAFEITATGGKLHDKDIATTDIIPDLSAYAKKTEIPTELPANGGNADTVNGHSVNADVPENAKFTDTVYTHPTTSGNKHIPAGGSSGQILRWSADGTAVWGSDNNTDTKVTSPSNHYTPTKSTTKSASGGTLTDIANSTLGTQVVTGVEMDAKGHVTGVVSTALKTSVPVIVSLTRNEYDSLATKDPNTYYMITDDIGDTTDAVVLNVGYNKEFTSFTSAMWVAAGITDQKVIVNVFAGEYDVYSELGGDNYIIGIGSSEWRDIQPLLSGNVEIKGIGNVVLKLEIPDNIYTNNKTNCEKVSTISTERNILVENITFVNKNCRYSIHDECGNSEGAANTKHIFRNCRFYNDNTISCIGVGTVTGYFEVENCYTENTTRGSFFLHDWVNSTGGNLIIKNCVFNSESGIDVILSVNSNPESVFDVYLANNVFKKLTITSADINQFNTNIFRVIGVHNTITTTAVNASLTNPYPIKLY